MALPITRRSLLAAMPVTATAIALPTLAGASTPDSGLEKAIAAYARLKAKASHFDTTVYDPAAATFEQRVAAIPHATTTRQFKMGKKLVRGCTSHEGVVRMARTILADDDRRHSNDFMDTCRELVALADERDRQVDQIMAETNVHQLARLSDEHGNRSSQALYAVEDYPVTTLPAMLRKIGVLYEAFGEDDDIWGDWTLADLRRIAGEA
ncbi:MAG: hypothetical protein IT550_08650 [Novosphingobium sp.]|nr:hypothetical protein [Novosphingobium sp.]